MAHPRDFGLADPKNVGADEYTAIHEMLADALEGCEEDVADSPADFTLAILTEFAGHAIAMLKRVKASTESA